ncbi:sigma-70 family RNA polymerase sigma factor [Butyricimonas hominis]|jgi:RNA polymerase sigma factor, sigma-70 family|uniref:Sigma-70 family RNA polymerase sigma factor n=1 Tax=Butyricimonas hominis TaxID=2763032 RepID=A0ABR7CWS7_9BACT|nr:sigma-70 family RNA polymerase sigma factor [Butyricimonas hominis]MBC5620128.1 sigma-70 family RNA polymerase sigma factor [Butyricimonas hominis]
MPEEKFEHIFKSYYSDIYNFIYHYIMNRDDTEDLVQDVFICFFEKYQTIPEEINTKQYLLAMSKNRCISFLRHKNVIDRNNLKYFESLVFSTTSEYDTTYDDLFTKLNLAMDNLSDLQKRIVEMKLAGKNYDEISNELNVTHSQVHKNIKKAYTKIRTYIGKNPDKSIHCLLFYLFFHSF